MPAPVETPIAFPFTATSPAGLRVQLNANGSVRRLDCGEIMLNLFPGTEADGGPINIHLRRRGATVDAIPLLGPGSPTVYQFNDRGLTGCGRWGDLRFRIRLLLADDATAWFWHVELENTGPEQVNCDLIHTQDLGIAHYGAIRLNEHYVSHYVDHAPLSHATKGLAIASRQNQSMGGRCPWTVIGSLGHGVSYATDALQFNGRAGRAGKPPAALHSGLPGQRLQHEHSLVCIQDEELVIEPGGTSTRGFFGWFEADHPAATKAGDVRVIDAALALPEAGCPPWPADPAGPPPTPCLFAAAPLLETDDLGPKELTALFGRSRRHPEHDGGRLLSFFAAQDSHVVLKAKELGVLRPHGHILRSGGALVPDEAALTSTAWMGGVFHSMVTQGHVSINRFLSTCHGYLGLFRSHGQRVFIEVGGAWYLLGAPSAFAMSPDSCRWIYKFGGAMLEVVSTAPADRHELRLTLRMLAGAPARFLISHHVALNGDDGCNPGPVVRESRGNEVLVRAVPDSDVGRRFPDGCFSIEATAGTTVQQIGGDELLFADGRSRNEPFLCFVTAPASEAGLLIRGLLVEPAIAQPAAFWESVTAGLNLTADPASPLAPAAARVAEILPWFVHNALVHYLSPRGLEQYSGGGWGTRDVCQGPLELLLALGRFEPARDLLCRVFRQQNPDGDWPQWFMFFDRERNIRPGDSHGDIVYWPVLALAQYLAATGDAGLLEERLPFFHPEGDAMAETATIDSHVERALELIRRRVVDGTVLAAYGHGDWNDSLQPARPDMREHLCSSWTVTLNHQTLIALAGAFRRLGHAGRANELATVAAKILDEFQQTLIVDEVVAGLVYFQDNGKPEYLLHPRDRTTGLSYSILPMIHAIINDMFTPDQAQAHLEIIRRHLSGPDGAHLFDRPMPYRGGIQRYFQRAESASYFGREIGIMYTHAHLRYCEALARIGDARGLFHGLCQANPIALSELVPAAARRQSNCYYSSSDPAFADRYQAFDEYDRVLRGEVPLEGGWRIYSSGAGIAVRLIIQCFLGLRLESSALVIDPVIAPELDGLKACLRLAGHPVEVVYRVTAAGCGPVAIDLNGTAVQFAREENRYRLGGARIPLELFIGRSTGKHDQLLVTLA
jgi:cellobiose phosphorylase